MVCKYADVLIKRSRSLSYSPLFAKPNMKKSRCQAAITDLKF
ncbi:hypothetical protein MY9_0641 [Bacillus sp. JS]|nr:hypothetical protein MY9_0641 [Bacillus sp. JS]